MITPAVLAVAWIAAMADNPAIAKGGINSHEMTSTRRYKWLPGY